MKECRWEFTVIRRVRKVLRLEADTASVNIKFSAFANEISPKKIPRIDLYSRLCRPHLQGSSCRCLMQARSLSQRAVGSSQYEIVIVAFCESELFIRCINARADLRQIGEIEWSSFGWSQLAGRNENRI